MGKKMGRRVLSSLTITAMTVVALLVSTGCGMSGNTPAGESKSTVQNVARTKAETDILRTNMISEPDSLDPWKSAASDTSAVMQNVFEGLLRYDTDAKILPGLAQSWKLSDDRLTYTFQLNKGVKFHNDHDLTAEDVVYTYQHLAGLDGNKAVAVRYSQIAAVKAINDYEVAITLKKPSAQFPALAAMGMILPKGYDKQAEHPIGTGPYKFVSYTPGQKIVLAKNESYFDQTRAAKIPKVEIHVIHDQATVISALQSGQLDLARLMSFNSLDVLNKDFNIMKSPSNMVQLLGLNNSVTPLNKLEVRQAINYAIDKKAVIDGVFSGFATELHSNFSPVMKEYYNERLDAYYSYDPEKAKDLLQKAGLLNGFTLNIKVPSNYTMHMDAAQIIAEQLSAVGIKAKIIPVEWATWLEEVNSKANYEATIISLTGKLDPADVLGRFSTSYKRNFTKFRNKEFDELIDRASTESDNEKRVEMYRECQEILAKEAGSVFICDPNIVMAVRKDIQGYKFYPVSFLDLAAISYTGK